MRRLVVASWYMVYKGWVKNVNKLRVNGSITGALSSPVWVNTLTTHIVINGQLPVIHQPVHFFTHQLSTLKNALLNLLFVSYPSYPHPLLLEPLKRI